jgi:hypothetical protein
MMIITVVMIVAVVAMKLKSERDWQIELRRVSNENKQWRTSLDN